MGTRYRYGVALEHRVRDHFEEASYYVMRSAGSGGVADLLALDLLMPKARPVMIQAKRTKADLSVRAWNYLLEIATAAGAVPLVAWERKNEPLAYDLYRITGPRRPKTTAKAWVLWELDPDRDRPQTPIALPSRPALCRCGHSSLEHTLTWCSECLCQAFVKDTVGVPGPRPVAELVLPDAAPAAPPCDYCRGMVAGVCRLCHRAKNPS